MRAKRAAIGRLSVIKYIGSKRTLIPAILGVVRKMDGLFPGGVRTVLDLFSGTSRVGHALKRAGYRVLANDHNAYAATLARCYVQADAEDVLADAEQLVAEFSRLPGQPGYFTRTFCQQSRYFQPKNGEKIDAIREAIAAKCLKPEIEAVMLVALMEAADRVDSTTGVQMAYLKEWAPRAANDLGLRVPEVLPRARLGKGRATCFDALQAAASLEADVAYIDPPYNQHSYLGNYHIWESLVRWDKPEVYGVACKRTDVRERRSCFNSRRRCADAMRSLLGAVQASALIVSFNNEGYLSREEMEAMLSTVTLSGGVAGGGAAGGGAAGGVRVVTIENDFKRYVGAQIGIYNPQGQKVGKVSHLRNKEYIYVVMPSDIADRFECDLAGHGARL